MVSDWEKAQTNPLELEKHNSESISGREPPSDEENGVCAAAIKIALHSVESIEGAPAPVLLAMLSNSSDIKCLRLVA